MLTPEERHLKELIDGLRADIRALTHALDKHTQAFEGTESSRHASYQQTEEARIRAVVLEQIQAEREAAKTKSEKKEWSSFEKWYFAVQFLLFIATTSAFGAAWWYASIADIQKNTLISQTAEISTSARAADSAARTAASELTQTKDAFVIDQRPYVIEDGRPIFVGAIATLAPSINVAIKDVGKTPARDTVQAARLIPFRDLVNGRLRRNTDLFLAFIDREAIELQLGATKDIRDRIAYLQDIAPAQTSPFSTIVLTGNITDQDATRIRTGDEFLIFMNVVQYKDSFGNSYRSDMCSFFWGTDPNVWHYCPTHNTIR
ncbi:MAG: hypothetical protein ABSG41_11320 [Bryobacteraceae bacterium]